MHEKDLNRIIAKYLRDNNNWSFKIPDANPIAIKPGSYLPNKNPFDGFGVLNNKPLYWESKYSKKLQAFNFNRIETHQLYNLQTLKQLLPNSYCLIIYGVTEGKGNHKIYVFDINTIAQRINKGDKSIKAKELETLPYIQIKKGTLDVEITSLQTYII